MDVDHRVIVHGVWAVDRRLSEERTHEDTLITPSPTSGTISITPAQQCAVFVLCLSTESILFQYS